MISAPNERYLFLVSPELGILIFFIVRALAVTYSSLRPGVAQPTNRAGGAKSYLHLKSYIN